MVMAGFELKPTTLSTTNTCRNRHPDFSGHGAMTMIVRLCLPHTPAGGISCHGAVTILPAARPEFSGYGAVTIKFLAPALARTHARTLKQTLVVTGDL